MARSIAVYFVSKEEFDFLENASNESVFKWGAENRNRFHGYIDDDYEEYVLVDEENGLYKRALWLYLSECEGKQIKELDIDRMFRNYAICDLFYNTSERVEKWKKLFKEADPESYLYLEYH